MTFVFASSGFSEEPTALHSFALITVIDSWSQRSYIQLLRGVERATLELVTVTQVRSSVRTCYPQIINNPNPAKNDSSARR